jgi:uncharacterized repeat protein (TIGR01451 family)
MKRTKSLTFALASVFALATAMVFGRGLVNADLSITKTDGAASSVAGTQVVYTITAINGGPADVTGASVTDAFPGTLTCTWTCSASAGSSCTAAGSGDINDSVNLLNLGSVTYTATCTLDPAATGMLSNTATVSSLLTDPNMADNSATDINTVTSAADLSVSAVFSPDPAVPGAAVTFTVLVDNLGPSTASSVVVSSVLPTGFTFDSTAGCAEDPGGVPSCSPTRARRRCGSRSTTRRSRTAACASSRARTAVRSDPTGR